MTRPPRPATIDSVVFFSYLAYVETLYVHSYPAREYGAEVVHRESFLAADGPIAAGAAVRLGTPAVLLSNSVADDPDGRLVRQTLDRWAVGTAGTGARRADTPASVVVCDSDGGRTFFPHLPGVVTELMALDLDAVDRARAVYVDCYEILHGASARVLRRLQRSGTPVLANLGGSPPPSWLGRHDLGREVSVLQTSVADGAVSQARSTARDLRDLSGAEIVLVTAGSAGAVIDAAGSSRLVPAPPVQVLRSQGAGSAFSGAFLHDWLRTGDLTESVSFACAAASLWCSSPSASMPATVTEVLSFLDRSHA